MIPGSIGQIGMINSRLVETYTFTTSAANQNLFTKAGSPVSAGDFTFIINSGVVISSTSNTAPALTTGSFPAGSTVRLINNGSIYGKGGDGGKGGNSSSGSKQTGSPGAGAGDAIELSFDITIENALGNIFGGGGGGGGGGGFSAAPAQYDGGDGGSGGQGESGGAAGVRGTGSAANGSAGNAGSVSGPGAAVNSASDGGAGGAGGAWGVDGSSGSAQSGGRAAGGAGGTAGRAVRLNGYVITWDSGNLAAQVKGLVA